MAVIIILLFSIPSLAQDKKPVDNKGKIKQMKAKSVKKKENASTKDIAGKRLRTKNTNSVAGRAIYSNPSPYANERRGKDRAAKPIGGQPLRIRSRSGETARSNVYPQRGPYVNHSSKRIDSGKSNRFRNRPRSRTSSAESSRSNVYPQKGPYVNRSSRQTEKPARRSKTRGGRLSTSARITKTYTRKPQSVSQSAETSKNRRFKQTGTYVNQSSRRTENVSSGINRFARRSKLSAGPRPTQKTGKNQNVTPRSASQPFITKGKKNVYWGKFSKGEKAITTDISGNPLRRRNYRTPPNEIIKPKDPYAGRKRSSGDRAYAGTFRSGHESASKRGEKAWIGDLSGQPIRKRPSRSTETAGRKPAKTGGGSISASAKYRSNKQLRVRGEPLSASGKIRDNSFRPKGGGSISATGKYRSNQPFKGRAASISASGKYRSNKPYQGRAASLSISGQNKEYNFEPKGGGSISASARYRSNQPLKGVAGSISASGKYRSNKPFKSRAGTLSISGKSRVYDFKPNGGGSISASGKYRSNQPLKEVAGSISASSKYRSNKPINDVAGSISASPKYRSNKPYNGRMKKLSVSDQNRTYAFKPKGGGSISGKIWNNNNQPINGKTPGIGASSLVNFQGNIKTKEPKKGGGSVSGKLWNNNGNPIEVRTPKGTRADEISGLQVSVKAKETGKKPKAVKGAMPGLAPTNSTVKASEYYRSITAFWSYEHNPSSADKSLKTIAPSDNFISASGFSGKTRLTKNYRHNPMSSKDALKVIAPGRAYARITDYQGNVKMSKYNNKRFLPDSKFAHNKENNVKHERTIMTDFKLLWTKIFKKNGIQPDAVKEKSVRPRYDKRERELWPGLYD